MAAAASKDPGRHIAMLALEETYGQPGKMLEAVIRHAFDQLCWHRTTPELETFAANLREIMAEDA
jgi:hypothetical protein